MKSTLLALVIASTFGTAFAGGTIDKIIKTHEITLGVRASGAPFSAVTDKGGYRGYSIDVCKKIVADFDRKYKTNTIIAFKEVNTANRYQMIDNQGIDMECAGSSVNPEKTMASFAVHYTDSILAATLATSKIKNLDDLAKSKVGIVNAFSGEKLTREALKAKNPNFKDDSVQTAENYDAIFLLLNQGRIDAAVTNKSLLMGIIAKQKKPADYRIVEDTKVKENDRIGIVTWSKDKEFSEFVKKSVKDMFAAGDLEKFHKANFGESLSAESKRDIAANQ